MAHESFKIHNISCHIVSNTLPFMCKIYIPAISIECPCRTHMPIPYWDIIANTTRKLCRLITHLCEERSILRGIFGTTIFLGNNLMLTAVIKFVRDGLHYKAFPTLITLITKLCGPHHKITIDCRAYIYKD